MSMKDKPGTIGEFARSTRKAMGVTRQQLAMTSGTGLRFIIEMEPGKPVCQIGKVLTVLETLGIIIELIPTAGNGDGLRKLFW
jgi:HTH-type transcriptional regulator / antitoxin HipB